MKKTMTARIVLKSLADLPGDGFTIHPPASTSVNTPPRPALQQVCCKIPVESPRSLESEKAVSVLMVSAAAPWARGGINE